jgi:hypothetical protein
LVTVVIALLTRTLWDEEERVKAGAASVGTLDEEEVGETLTIFSARVVMGAGEVAAFDEPFIL